MPPRLVQKAITLQIAAMADPLAQALQSLTLIQQAITSGTLNANEEIETREASAQLAEMLFQATRDPTRLSEAIQHYQAIIRLLKSPSLRRAKFLDNLAYLEMSVFAVTESMKVLDDSIAHSKQARDETLPTNDPFICTVYHNLGYSVSHRAQLTNNVVDLNEAIACGREVIRLASPKSTEHQATLVNLAGRLHSHYKMRHQSADAEEALSLLDSQLQRFPPGSPQHGSALMVRSNILHDKFEQTNNIQDLDSAIAGFAAGLKSIGETHERTPDVLRQLALLHHLRYQRIEDIADLKAATDYSKAKLRLIPRTYPTRPDHVAAHLSHLVEYIFVVDSLDTVQNGLEAARALRDEVAKTHAKRHSCNLSLASVLSTQYFLSHDIKHLEEVVSHALSSVDAWNEKLDITRPRVPTQGLFDFSLRVREIETAPADPPVGKVRGQALERLYQWHLPVQKSRTILDAMVNMVHEHEQELEVFCRNLTSVERLSEEQINAGIGQLKEEKATKSAEDQKRMDEIRSLDRDDYTDLFLATEIWPLTPKTND